MALGTHQDQPTVPAAWVAAVPRCCARSYQCYVCAACGCLCVLTCGGARGLVGVRARVDSGSRDTQARTHTQLRTHAHTGAHAHAYTDARTGTCTSPFVSRPPGPLPPMWVWLGLFARCCAYVLGPGWVGLEPAECRARLVRCLPRHGPPLWVYASPPWGVLYRIVFSPNPNPKP